VRSIANEQDVGISRGFWQRTLDFFTGTTGTRIVRPHGVLFDAHDRLFIADPGAGLVHCMDLGAGRYFVIGEDGPPLETPIGLAIDDREQLYVTDSTQGLVFRYDLAAQTLKPFLSGGLSRPTGIAWNPVNRLLYIVDTTARQVVVVDEQGLIRQRLGNSVTNDENGDVHVQFNRPTDIWIDTRGQLYVTDPLNASIKLFTPEGLLLTQFGIPGDAPGEFNKPKGVATDSSGHIYVNDALLDAVQIFDHDGTPLLVFGGAGSGPGEFWMPSGLYIDPSDRIFVTDTYNQRVQVFRYLPAAARSKP
jgi:DNA-binding beta-propeller fold protein YncE